MELCTKAPRQQQCKSFSRYAFDIEVARFESCRDGTSTQAG